MTKLNVEAMQIMRASGLSDAAIASHFNLSRQRVGQLLGKPDTPHKRAPQIASLAAPETYSDAPLPTALRAWRARYNLTQPEAAKRLHLSNATVISRWERTGKCGVAGLVVDRLRMEDALADLVALRDAGMAIAPKHTSDVNIEYIQKCWAAAKELLTKQD